MTQLDRQQLEVMLLGLSDHYGPWAVLWEFTQIMKKPFSKQANNDKPPKRRKKNNDETLEPPEFVNPMPFGDQR